MLYYLNHHRTATELAEVGGISRATVYRRLDNLQAVGIIGKSASHYQLNARFRHCRRSREDWSTTDGMQARSEVFLSRRLGGP